MEPGFSIVARGPAKRYEVVAGLAPGYRVQDPGGEVFDQAANKVLGWMARREAAGLYAPRGIATCGDLLYVWPARAPDEQGGRQRETALVFSGQVSPVYHAAVTDLQVAEALNDLAAFLAETLKQVRVYVTYRDETWVVQRGEMPPR